ncbi:restriction endonuclease subunit S [Levilactobacillus angrenensis]|uniref:Restriction endonuclease subunit S n=1 Tax=Levilactobacillus angrenensis TaxID=2486020 RepID=A0ABW1UBM6_9LACO|nr:restriction endonuclease subunit S [Levilactobacillus angrenensis]
MKDNQAKYPQLRFKDFDDPWEQRKLGKIGKTFTGLSGKTKEDFGHGDAKFVTYMNVFSNPVSDLEMIDNIEVDAKQNSVEYGDVFFTTSSETPEEVGMSSVWLGNKDNVYLNSFSFGYRPDKIFAPYYLAFMLRSPVIRRKFMFLAQGISRYNISKTKVMNMEVPVPKLEEQQQIGSFFKQLDNTIALHQRKLAKLKKLKQGYLQKLFPKNGSKFPQLRFAGFADAWEERKLGDLATSFEYGLNASAKEFDGIHKYIRITDIDDSSRKFDHESLTSPDIDLSSADNYKLQYGDILFARTGASVGKTYIYSDSDGLVYYAGFLIRARIKSGVDSNFIFQHTLTSSYENFIRVTSQRSGQPGVNAKEYSIFEISVPSYEEQQRIGSFFKQLDNTIALHQRKLEKLQELKKGYLQKMFC